MSLHPIPEEELAKLVLGYLADEQLVSVYDEFLLASPYLDAAQNEYSRIFMKSLQSIVSEFFATKIYVEKCKPFSLRKKLTKCSDLLEVVKFLITHVDHKKISSLNCSNEKTSNFIQTQNSTIRRYCTSCGSLREACGCREHAGETEGRDITPTSLEATALTDLAGHSTAKVKRKHVKVLQKDSKEAARLFGYDSNEESQRHCGSLQVDLPIHNTSHSLYNNYMTQPSDVTDTHAISSIRHSATPAHFNASEGGRCDVTNKTNQLVFDVPSSKDCGNFKNTAPVDSTQPDNAPVPSNLAPARLAPSAAAAAAGNTQYLIQVSGSKNLEIVPHTASDKPLDDRVTILSDVKVDAKVKGADAMVTSTPLLKVHQIVLTAAKGEVKKAFTKEEIMAMPTCFVVSSSSGTLPVRSLTDSRPVSGVTTTSSGLGPLTIDITSSPTIDNKVTDNKIIDKIASMPKESLLAVGKSSTPHALPPARKSSSTPRRSSHIRVLDFSTPRRILQGVPEAPAEDDLVSRSPHLCIDETRTQDAARSFAKPSKSGWDADLRALIANSEPPPQTKRKRKPTPKQPAPAETPAPPATAKKPKKPRPKKQKPKPAPAASPSPAAAAAAALPKEAESTVKPTINIIVDWNEKPSSAEADTPELERISLPHDIGAKLNISDLLETPFKQALYDIQMDTPKFLRPDLPDEPVSEIKICDIPTPRFLESAAKPQTPYASRGTDYSSGGSYYKPDDDFALPPHAELPEVRDRSKSDTSDRSGGARPLRPVRKCTRNVSYRAKRRPAELDTSGASAAVESADEDAKENAAADGNRRRSTTKPKKTPKKTTPKSFMKIKPRRPTPKRKPAQSKRKSAKAEDAAKTPAPTKSRRKSATPRKLHPKVFGSESPEHSSGSAETKPRAAVPDTDSELPLRWSDDGSRDANREPAEPSNEAEDITKIQRYIESTETTKRTIDECGQLHIDLVKRGFDIETARSIERDLLDLSPVNTTVVTNVIVAPADSVGTQAPVEPAPPTRIEDDGDASKDEDEDIELSVCECGDEQVIRYVYEESVRRTDVVHTLKDNYTMEFCLDEDFSVTLKTDAFKATLECEPVELVDNETVLETEAAVESIMSFDSLYTPMKRAVQAQCKEIFDSTLTSIDTPLKGPSPSPSPAVTQITLEVEPGTASARPPKRRRRALSGSCSDESGTDKKPRQDHRYLTNIQNIDIETVLSKLHGP